MLRRLMRPGARDIKAGDVLGRGAGGQNFSHDRPHAARRQDTQRIQARGHVEPVNLGGLADQIGPIGRETFRPAEKRLDPGGFHHRIAFERGLKKRGHPVPVRRQGRKTGVIRDAFQVPRSALRLEQAKQHAAAFLADVSVG